MTKPTKTADELRTEILDAADPKREYLNIHIHGRPDGSGTWGIVLTGSSIPQTMIDAANRKANDLAKNFNLAAS